MKLAHLPIAVAISVLSFAGVHAQDRSVVLSYMTDTAPTIDGELDGSEWDAAGPWINVTVDAPNADFATDEIPDDPWGGDEDLSYRFKTMWVEETANFYLIAEVTDDIAMSEDPTNLWERDQAEIFFDGTNVEGDDDINSFHWWDNEETYGKFGVSRYNTFEGNSGKMTDDVDIWDEGFATDIIALSAVADIGTNADYRIELAVSLLPMIDDPNFFPFDGTPTYDEGTIVADETQMKFTIAISDDDDFETEDTSRSSVITYYREIDGEGTPWDQSTGFADLVFTGEFDGVLTPEPVAGDCNGDGVVNNSDLTCATNPAIGDTLDALGVLPGDFDGNTKVEFADFLVLSSNFGQDGKTYAEGNADGLGKVEFADFLLLSNNFGQSSAAASSVPEPSAGLLLGLGALALGMVRRRR